MPLRTYRSQQASSSRRPRAPDPPSEPEEAEEDGQANGGDEGEEQRDEGEGEEATQSSGSGMTEEQINAAAAQVVRFAMFQEYKRRSMVRADIVRVAFPNHARSFNTVLERARKLARKDFGMDIVELRAKYRAGDEIANGSSAGKGKKRAQEANGDDEEEEEAPGESGETQAPARKKVAGSKTYAMRSILPVKLVHALSKPRALPDMEDDEEDVANGRGIEDQMDSGALLRLDKGDGTASGNIGLLGIRTVILCIVLVYGRLITDDELHALLRRLNLYRETILPYRSSDHREPPMTLDKYLDLMSRQGYLEKTKIPSPNGQPGEGESAEWRWGSRADLEFSEVAAADFIQRVFEKTDEDDVVRHADEDDEDAAGAGGNRVQRRRREEEASEQRKAKRREELHKKLTLAAGSALTGEL
ncbi:MAGE family-domain-containing protein [Kockovaella imperatae]|uniref:MAGE family-domain-containing protein n=1 Tax=Kockovaella imperatae TaxID=4999 RepID=A0A1Y1UP16_9TREE|nr:MAGE family-domain-containing protein [Kockovaella imperatae]ORX39287.1 MAGE family-domain-containing protein [Kockovaella imperatae]